MTAENYEKLKMLRAEADEIAAGKIGFPRCVEWQAEFVGACYEHLPELLKVLAAHAAIR